MNLKLFVIAGSALLGASLVAPLAQAEDSGQPEAAAAPDTNLRKVTIKVKHVDQAHHTVTFEARVSPEAQVERDGQPMRIDRLKAGDEVRAAFDPTTGEVMKLEIEKGTPRAPADNMMGK